MESLGPMTCGRVATGLCKGSDVSGGLCIVLLDLPVGVVYLIQSILDGGCL